MQINECLNVSCPKSRQSFKRGAAPAGRVGRGARRSHYAEGESQYAKQRGRRGRQVLAMHTVAVQRFGARERLSAVAVAGHL